MRQKLPLVLFALLTVCTLILGATLALRSQTVYEWRDTPQWSFNDKQRKDLAAQNPLRIEAYVRQNPRLRREFQRWLMPLQFIAPQLELTFVNPDTDPLRVQDRGITREGQLYIQLGQTGKRLDTPSVAAVERTLLELLYQGQKQIVHIQGQGERAFLSDTAGSWLSVYQALRADNHLIAALEPANVSHIPEQTDLLIIADPARGTLEDARWLAQYLERGGNLIYATDTRHAYLPPVLQAISGLRIAPGVIVDANAQQYGFNNPQTLVIEEVGANPALHGLRQLPVIPGAVALHPATESQSGWLREVLLYTSPQSWTESDPFADTLNLDEGEQRGPLTIAWQLSRNVGDKAQFIWILGDSDAWITPYREQGGNRQWFTQTFSHLLGNDAALASVSTPPKDLHINASQTRLYTLATVLLLVLPLLAALGGWLYFRMLKWRYRAN